MAISRSIGRRKADPRAYDIQAHAAPEMDLIPQIGSLTLRDIEPHQIAPSWGLALQDNWKFGCADSVQRAVEQLILDDVQHRHSGDQMRLSDSIQSTPATIDVLFRKNIAVESRRATTSSLPTTSHSSSLRQPGQSYALVGSCLSQPTPLLKSRTRPKHKRLK